MCFFVHRRIPRGHGRGSPHSRIDCEGSVWEGGVCHTQNRLKPCSYVWQFRSFAIRGVFNCHTTKFNYSGIWRLRFGMQLQFVYAVNADVGNSNSFMQANPCLKSPSVHQPPNGIVVYACE